MLIGLLFTTLNTAKPMDFLLSRIVTRPGAGQEPIHDEFFSLFVDTTEVTIHDDVLFYMYINFSLVYCNINIVF